MSHPWAFIGGGNMARAIGEGGLHAGVLHPGLLGIAEPDATKHEGLRALTPNIFPDAPTLLAWLVHHEPAPGAGRLVLAVKPQMLGGVASELRPLLEQSRLRRTVVSILAGTPTARLERELGVHAAIVRVMPNTPAKVRAGATAYCLGASARDADAGPVVELFRAVGPLVERIDESLMDAFTGLAGSGPAYLFYLAEAMIDAAVGCGFDRAAADRIVRQTLAGSGQLLTTEAGLPPETLRANVTSKGGTTAAATRVLDEAGVRESLVRAIIAARDRGRELGG